jgi:hypothetical protein
MIGRELKYAATEARPLIAAWLLTCGTVVGIVLLLLSMFSLLASVVVLAKIPEGHAVKPAGDPIALPTFESPEEAQQWAAKQAARRGK